VRAAGAALLARLGRVGRAPRGGDDGGYWRLVGAPNARGWGKVRGRPRDLITYGAGGGRVPGGGVKAPRRSRPVVLIPGAIPWWIPGRVLRRGGVHDYRGAPRGWRGGPLPGKKTS